MLIACPDCNESVSDQAFTCRKCGHPINSWIYSAKRWMRQRVAANKVELVLLLMLTCFTASLLSLPVASGTVLGVLWIPIWMLRGGEILWRVVLIEWCLIALLGGFWILWLRAPDGQSREPHDPAA